LKKKRATKTGNATHALMAAALALPIVAIPVVVHAQATENKDPAAGVLPPGAVVGLRSLWYREDGNRMKVTEPVAWVKSPIGDKWEVAGSVTVDMVSGASPIIVSNGVTAANPTGKPTQILTGASITDRRKAYDASLTRKYGELNENTVGVSFARSDEKDYESKAYGVNATFDFNERNTTLALGFGGRRDDVMSVTDRSLNAKREAKEFLVGVTQLIDRRTLIQSNITHSKLSGYLNDPYKLTLSFYRDGLSPSVAFIRDLRPETRTQIAWLTRGKRALTEQAAVVSAEYRYYRDDWGIRSHTLAGSWLQNVGERFQVEAGLRYYTQSKADFYRAEITQRPVPRFSSSDQRLSAFNAWEPSLKLVVKLTDQLSWDLRYARYLQKQKQDFESLKATLIDSGLIYRF
jgi:hypothetical protein